MDNVAEILRLLNNVVRLGTIAQVDHGAARVRVTSGALLTDWLAWLTPRAGDTRHWDPPTVGEQVILLSPSGDPANAIILTGLYSAAHAAPSNSADRHRIEYPDGAVIDYDHAAHHLAATIPGDVTVSAAGNLAAAIDGNISATAGGQLTADVTGPSTLTSPQITADVTGPSTLTSPQITANGNVTINGNLALNGSFSGSSGYSVTFNSPAEFKDTVAFDAAMTHNGKTIDSSHKHDGVTAGGDNSGEVV